MKRSEHAYTVAAGVDKVAEVLLRPEFQLELAQARDDVQSAELVWIEPGRVFELHVLEYERGRTGKVDRSRTRTAVTHYRWSGQTLHLSWEWRGEEKRIAISGGVRLAADGQGTRITSYRSVEVRLPLIGGRIERIIDREFDSSDERYRSVMRGHLGL